MILLWFSILSLHAPRSTFLQAFIVQTFLHSVGWKLLTSHLNRPINVDIAFTCRGENFYCEFNFIFIKTLDLKFIMFQDDIALVICMIILMAVTAGVVMFKVKICFINFNRKVHIREGVSSDLFQYICHSSIFSISTWSMFVLLSNYLKSRQFLVHSDSDSTSST